LFKPNSQVYIKEWFYDVFDLSKPIAKLNFAFSDASFSQQIQIVFDLTNSDIATFGGTARTAGYTGQCDGVFSRSNLIFDKDNTKNFSITIPCICDTWVNDKSSIINNGSTEVLSSSIPCKIEIKLTGSVENDIYYIKELYITRCVCSMIALREGGSISTPQSISSSLSITNLRIQGSTHDLTIPETFTRQIFNTPQYPVTPQGTFKPLTLTLDSQDKDVQAFLENLNDSKISYQIALIENDTNLKAISDSQNCFLSLNKSPYVQIKNPIQQNTDSITFTGRFNSTSDLKEKCIKHWWIIESVNKSYEFKSEIFYSPDLSYSIPLLESGEYRVYLYVEDNYGHEYSSFTRFTVSNSALNAKLPTPIIDYENCGISLNLKKYSIPLANVQDIENSVKIDGERLVLQPNIENCDLGFCREYKLSFKDTIYVSMIIDWNNQKESLYGPAIKIEGEEELRYLEIPSQTGTFFIEYAISQNNLLWQCHVFNDTTGKWKLLYKENNDINCSKFVLHSLRMYPETKLDYFVVRKNISSLEYGKTPIMKSNLDPYSPLTDFYFMMFQNPHYPLETSPFSNLTFRHFSLYKQVNDQPNFLVSEWFFGDIDSEIIIKDFSVSKNEKIKYFFRSTYANHDGKNTINWKNIYNIDDRYNYIISDLLIFNEALYIGNTLNQNVKIIENYKHIPMESFDNLIKQRDYRAKCFHHIASYEDEVSDQMLDCFGEFEPVIFDECDKWCLYTTTGAVPKHLSGGDWNGYNENVLSVDKVFFFEMNVETGAMKNNTDFSVIKNFTPYPHIQRSPSNYWSGQLKGLLGRLAIDDCTFKQTPSMLQEIKELTQNTSRKFLKDRDGNFWEVELSSDITIDNNDKLDVQLKTKSFNWVEVGDASNISLVSVGSGQESWLLTELGYEKIDTYHTWDDNAIWNDNDFWTESE
jgi:hypothetical protein